MRLLLDTHIFIWTVIDDPRLKPTTKQLMERAQRIFVSAASMWEIAIKTRLGKIDADPEKLADAIAASGFVELPVLVAHAAGVAKLPLYHTDPFDRLLIAQAIFEPLKLLTADTVLEQYGDIVVLA